uniref:Uncharacterized protein n=1 Tax=viral metagenome TaxID=1070528 RepID=A0A6C0JGD3_9ZZZZ
MLDTTTNEVIPYTAYAMIGVTTLVLAYATLSDSTKVLNTNPENEEPNQNVPVVPVSPIIPVSPFSPVPEEVPVAEPVPEVPNPVPAPENKLAGGKKRKNKSLKKKRK